MHKLFIFNFLALIHSACSDVIPTNEVYTYVTSKNECILDTDRSRQIPIHIYSLSDASQWNGELVILNAGYGSSNTEYDYITTELAQKGYYVISIQHEIQTDEMLPTGDDIIASRTPNWREGIKSVEQVLKFAKKTVPNISTKKIHLIGHSNGGDISVLFATENSKRVHSLITLDHRRMPIPLSKDFKTLSFRSDQFEADPGVIPRKSDQRKYGIEIVFLEGVDHNYLRDTATEKTKDVINSVISEFMKTEK